MSKSAICILTAGLGTRVGSIGQIANKALVPIGHRAAISLILDRFDPSLDVVLAVGHNAQIVKDYMAIAHSDRNIRYVDVDNFTGPGSGPGYSLLSCREQLQRPFYFVACDTLWKTAPLPSDVDWMGVSEYPSSDTTPFCNLQLIDGKITSLEDKTQVDPDAHRPFVGLAHVKNFQKFWSGLAAPGSMAQGEHQVSAGFKALLESGMRALAVTWTDIGTQEGLKKANNEAFDFSKTDELLFFENGKVIKFFKDVKVAQDRVKRAGMMGDVVPSITDSKGHFYAYKFEPGSTFYQAGYDDLFKELLPWLDARLWRPVDAPKTKVVEVCRKFYFDKTMQRVELFRKKYPGLDGSLMINGRKVAPLETMLKGLPWESLQDGRPVMFHGDLQFDNIVVMKGEPKFLLIDWRNDFGGQTDFGDLYYDLSKLLGGLFLNYDLIKQNLMWVKEVGDGKYEIDFARRYTYDRLAETLFAYCRAHGIDEKRVRILTGIIFLNMAPLHHAPFDLMLFLLSRHWLHQELS